MAGKPVHRPRLDSRPFRAGFPSRGELYGGQVVNVGFAGLRVLRERLVQRDSLDPADLVDRDPLTVE